MEPSAVTVKDEMTTLAADSPDMFTAMTTGSSCRQIVSEAAINGMHEDTPYLFLSSACKVTTPVQTLGEAADGWWAVGGGLKDVDVMTHPMLVEGLGVKMHGNNDAFLVEGSDISSWSAGDQAWAQHSVIELDVQTPNCAWDQSAARCR